MKRYVSFLPHFLLSFTVLSVIFVVPEQANAGGELTLHNFSPNLPGMFPQGGLTSDAAGNLYGVTQNGGLFNRGTVFEFSPNQRAGWNERILYNFQGLVDGSDPQGGLIFDAVGNLYGMTAGGGAGNGTVFELKHNPDGSWTESVLSDIDDLHGDIESGLVFDSAGNLYGAVGGGGPHSGGVVFQLHPTSSGKWQQTVLHSFSSNGNITGGTEPLGPLVVDQAGNVFGTTFSGGIDCFYGGCGLVFELSPVSGGQWTETVLYDFTGGSDGEFLQGGLTADQAGNLYGTATRGGTANATCYCGTVFMLSPNVSGQWTEKTIYAFQGGSDGSFPVYSLTFDGAGNLYGVTNDGGGLGYCSGGGCGTVFELTPTGSGQWTETVLSRFDNVTTGYTPSSGLFVDAQGQLFGEMTYGANLGQNGTLYELTPNGGQWNFTTVSGFADGDGFYPLTALVADSNGNLFGTTAYGGNFGIGAVYEVTPVSGHSNEKLIYSFPSGGHGIGGPFRPSTLPSPLIVDTAGNLFGEAEAGGDKNAGMVYELSPAANGTWTETTLYSFPSGVGGNGPTGGLIMDQAGNLYGTTEYGGLGVHGAQQSGNGIVFELIRGQNGTWSKKTLYEFVGYPSDGSQSTASLIFDTAGNLYGTTSVGGHGTCTATNGTIIGCGTAFELAPVNGGWQETVLHSFAGTQDGIRPLAGLLLDKSGNLFGTTVSGGIGFGGAVFELSPASGGGWNESLVFGFPDNNGQTAPYGNLILDASDNLYSTTSGVSNATQEGSVFKLSPNSRGGWTYTTLYDFTNLGLGSPEAGVIFGPKGYLYGTTSNGGMGANLYTGIVFAITP